MTETLDATRRGVASPRIIWTIAATVAVLVALVGGVWTYNQVVLQDPLQRVLLSDPRNRVVEVSARFGGWVDTSTVVFDLTEISPNASNVDIFRVFLEYAEAQKTHHFGWVVLAAYGREKFMVPGDYFQQLGTEYSTQNPIYTMRTFAHHVVAMDGSKPYPEVDGGLLYVMTKEMDQFKEFNARWFFDDYVARHPQNG